MRKLTLLIGVIAVMLFSAGNVIAIGWSDDGTTVRLDTSTDYVSIGTSSQGDKLTIVGGNIQVPRSSYIGSSGLSTIQVGSSGGAQIEFENTSIGDRLHFITHTSGVSHARRITIDEGGKLSPLQIKMASGNTELLKLETSTGIWTFTNATNPTTSNRSYLRIYGNASDRGLDFLISDDNHVAIWPIGEPLYNSPFVGIENNTNALSVWGDLVTGDIHHHHRTQAHNFMRLQSGIPTTSTTNLYSNRYFNKDIDGGAGITLVPITNGTDDGDDGYLQFFAFGKGNGANTNSIRFSTRSGVDSVSERMRVASNGNVGIGTTNPTSLLEVSNTGYFQFSKTSASAPPSADCDADNERGRLVIMTNSNRLYVCNGATRGWDYVALTN